MKFRPLHDRVVVKRIDAEAKSAGGIIIPDTGKEKPSQGEVTAIGPGGRDEAGKPATKSRTSTRPFLMMSQYGAQSASQPSVVRALCMAARACTKLPLPFATASNAIIATFQ